MTVADRGPGVPDEERERIFEKFHRAAGGGGGIGLGLAICRGIVTAHGGRIWAEPRAGGGAVFRFTLPVRRTSPPAPARSRTRRCRADRPGPIVLVIDDEQPMRRFLRAALDPSVVPA